MEEIIREEVQEALKLCQIKGKVTIHPIDSIRFVVCVEGTYFGIWDTDRKTFVD